MSSNYRNYATWTKPTSSYSSIPSKTPSKFDVAFGKGRSEPKKDDDRSTTSRIATKYSSGIRNVTKQPEKKEISHPPVSYRPLGTTRVGSSRSRDPSPDKSFSYNRLCPKPYTSTSRAASPGTTIPKYTGRSSLSKEEPISKYSRGSSITKEDIPKYSGRSSLSKDSSSSTSQKYITSRFLPKNTIEKSFTASIRPSTVRTNEVSRKNREILNVLHAQQETRPSSRCSSVTPEPKSMVLMVTRSTSPNPNGDPSKPIDRFETVRKNKPKEDASTQTEETSKNHKLGVRSTAAPWCSILDMKFSSPDKQQPKKSLPPQIPAKNPALHSTTNKDFRKSVLNMNTGKKIGRRSNSASSAESDHSETTDVSESLSSYPSSRLPQRVKRSPSSDTSSTSEEKEPRAKNEAEAKTFLMRALAPVTNLFKANKYSDEKVNWMDSSEGVKVAGRNMSKDESGEKTWWMDDTTVSESLPKDSDSGPKAWEEQKNYDPQASAGNNTENRYSANQSGEVPWWLDKNAAVPDGVQTYDESPVVSKKQFGSQQSSEVPWWLDKNAPVPEGVQKWDSGSKGTANIDNNSKYSHEIPSWLERNDSAVVDARQHADQPSKNSSEIPWWLDKNAPVPEGVQAWKASHSSADNTSKDAPWWVERNSSSQEVSQPKNKENAQWSDNNDQQDGVSFPHKLRHIDSGERAWWLCSSEDIPHMEENNIPLGDRRSPDGLETKEEDRLSPYDNVPRQRKNHQAFISKHRNIDEILGSGQIWMDKFFEEGVEVDVGQVRIHDSTPQRGIIEPNRIDNIGGFPKKFSSVSRLDDAALQLYKDGDYGSYLDLEASISEQQEEFEGFQSNKKNSIVLRTQLSVRVHTIIEKLLTSEGRELRRALFSLKQIFQEDKDLVHEFVQNDGLSCLIKVGSEADQNYQNYILRALGQVMLYVDGMNGVMEHNPTIQWLYSLISSKFRLVVKTALKLLLVFVEYTESNCMLLIKAIHTVDTSMGELPWHNIMKLLKDFDSADTELLIYASTLINKILNGIPDQDNYYDQTDALEEQDFEKIIQRYMSKPGTDLDLLQQFQIYEAVLQYEDGEESRNAPRLLDESVRQTLRTRKSLADSGERRKSRRHSTGTTPHSRGEDSSSSQSEKSQINGCYKDKANDAGVTPALRRRRERAERQRSFMKEQQETVLLRQNNLQNENEGYPLQQHFTNRKDLTPLLNAVNKLDADQRLIHDLDDSEVLLKRENTVKDLTQKLANQKILHSPSEEPKMRIGDMSGLISKAKEGLAKSKPRVELARSPTQESANKPDKKSESELRWEELIAGLNRPLNLCDIDFTDLTTEDEADVLTPVAVGNGIPPPPPPLQLGAPPPPPGRIPPPVPPPSFKLSKAPETKIPIKKNKKTVKLFWKEVREDPICSMKLKTGYIWDELKPVCVDTQKLEHLFESRAKDLISKKQQEMNKNKEIIVLDPKRSNAINIGMTKLPPPRSIKTAILKMDATIMNREGIEKLLTMLPTEEERTKIQEAQAANPDLPLGSAEQFLLTLASISELPARLRLWAFKLDFENSEREIAEPLMDLKQGFEALKANKTFRAILSTLLSIGNFLNGNEVKGFQIEYLAKVPEVKDTVHKHSLLHHLCHIVMEKFPEATDLYSEIGPITRASKVDFDELTLNIQRLESDCKSSWDHLKVIAKHDGSTMMKVKMSDFLADCAERIIILGIIHRRIMNRFHKFLLWLGIPLHQISDTKPNEFCRIVSEFALEYRTTRERVLQQLEKKANHRERNKTRGKMITDIGKFRSKEDRADAELRQLLGSDISDVESIQGTLPWRRNRTRDSNRSFLGQANGNLTDADDEIIESLVKTATKGPVRTGPRERKRTRHADRKSLRRTLKNGLSEEEKSHLSAYIKGY